MSSKTGAADGPILIYEGPEGTQRYPVGSRPVLIGRGNDADIRLGDLSLSGRHARIEPSGSDWKIVDQGSRNGTFVNDVLVKQRKLGDGDRVRLGRVQFRFLLSGEQEDQFTHVRNLVAEAHRRHGDEGLRTLARDFVEAAAQHGESSLLVGSDELRAAKNLQRVMKAMVEARSPKQVFEMIVDVLIEFTGAERGFFILLDPPQGTVKKKKKTATGDVQREVMAALFFVLEEIQVALAKFRLMVEFDMLENGVAMIM